MTNAMIVFAEGQRLAEEGKIKYTGRTFQLDDGTICRETEPIHTYAVWQQMGFQVQKGQKAVAQFTIWKHSEKDKEDGTKDEKMFMKRASFFSLSQVERMVAE